MTNLGIIKNLSEKIIINVISGELSEEDVIKKLNDIIENNPPETISEMNERTRID